MIDRRDASSSADISRYAGDLTPSTGLLAHTGASYSDTTTLTAINILYDGVRSDVDIVPAINRALEWCYAQEVVPLTLVADGDMQASGTSSYTGSSATLSKDTGAANVFQGRQALKIVTTAQNGYAESTAIPVREGEMVYVAAIGIVSTGQLTIEIWDQTNSVALATNVIEGEAKPQLLWNRVGVGQTTKNITIRLIGSSASNTLYISTLWAYRILDRRIYLPAYTNERFKIGALVRARFLTPGGDVSPASTGNVLDAFSIDPEEMPQTSYQFLFANAEANPYAVQMNDPWGYLDHYPLMIQVKRPYSDYGTLSAGTDSTTAPMHLIKAAAKWQLMLSLQNRIPDGQQKLAAALQEFQQASAVRAWEGPAKRFPNWAMARARN